MINSASMNSMAEEVRADIDAAFIFLECVRSTVHIALKLLL
jgi:hypothetical protein